MREAYGRSMLVRDLAWLVALAEAGQVTDAAAVLGVSQPTLSRALSRMEAEVGARLFERTASGVRPTPDGELVLDGARDVTQRWDRVLAELAARHDPDSGVVRLAFLDSMATSLVPRLLQAFHQHAPRVRLELRQEPSHVILDDLATGAAELAVTSPQPSEHAWWPLQEERLLVVVPPSHRLRSRRRVRLEELAEEDLVTTPVGFGYRSLVEGLFAAAGVVPRVTFESADLATIEGLVSAGLGVALVPEPFVGLTGSVGLTLTTPAARRVVGLTWRSDVPLSPAAARFRDFVRASWAGGEP